MAADPPEGQPLVSAASQQTSASTQEIATLAQTAGDVDRLVSRFRLA